MKTFKTTDYALAAYLLTVGFELLTYEHNPDNPRQIIFVFDETPKLKRATDDFWTKRARVEPIAYLTNLKRIKAIIHTAWQNQVKIVSEGSD